MRFSYKIPKVMIPIALVLVLPGPMAALLPSAPLCAAESMANEDFLNAGIQAERQGDFSAAEAAYESVARTAKEQGRTKQEASACHRLAVLKAKQGQIGESENLFRQAVHLDSGNVAMLCDFAKLFSDRRQYQDAETVLKNAALAAPDNRRVLYNLGHAIASQENRQTEGLRYLKLALGETRAYRELAKICETTGSEDAGKREQAEYARQRAAALEQTGTPPESLNSPTVPMDEPTRKEIVDRIRQELLRQETAEIAEEQQKETPTVQAFQSRPIDSTAKWGVPERPSPTEPESLIEQEEDPFLATLSPQQNNSSVEPVLMATENGKNKTMGEKPKDSVVETPPPLPPPIETSTDNQTVKTVKEKVPENDSRTLPMLPRIVPLKTTSSETATKKEPKSVSTPEIHSVPIELAEKPEPKLPSIAPLQAASPESPAEPPIAETKALPQEKRQSEQISRLRVLPEPEHRISNSQDALATGDSTNGISPLPILVLPLDDKPAKASLPEYTAIGIKRIPSVKKESISPENVPRFAASERRGSNDGNSPDIRLSLNKSNVAETATASQDSISPHPPQLAQPVSLITMESRYSVPRQNVGGPRQDTALRRLASVAPGLEEPGNESLKPIGKRLNSDTSSEKSVLRPGAGKNWNREDNEDYVFVKPEKPEEDESRRDQGEKHSVSLVVPPRTGLMDESKMAVRLIAPERAAMDAASSHFRRTPEITTEQAKEPEADVPLPGEERSELQFSSNHAPNVLKFELSRSENDPFLAMPEPTRKTDDRVQPPTVLKFSPSGESTLAVRQPEEDDRAKSQTEEPLLARHTSEQISPPEQTPVRPNFPILKEQNNLRSTHVAASENPTATTEIAEKRNTVRFVPAPHPEIPKETTETLNLASLPERNSAGTFGDNPMRNLPAPVAPEDPAPLDFSRLARIVENSEPRPKPSLPKPPQSEPRRESPVQVAVAPVYEAPVPKMPEATGTPDSRPEIAMTEIDDPIGFATSRKTIPATDPVSKGRSKIESDVDAILAPQKTLSGLSTLSEKTGESNRSEAGFARSGSYSGTIVK